MPTKNLGLKTQDSPGRECGRCACAATVWNGRPDEWVCVNSPGHAGQMTRVPASGSEAESCRGFRAKPEAPVRSELPTPTDESVRYIAMESGLFAIVDAGDFDWLNRYSWRASGGNSSYACCKIDGRQVFMHRLIMNPPAGMVVDHINGNRWDNRRGNLRVCTQAENLRNRRSCRGTSRFKGVSWNSRIHKWAAAICLNSKTMHLGYFADEVEAARAYDRKARELFGPFAYLNFPNLSRIVLLSGRICVRSCVRGRIRVMKSEIRILDSRLRGNDTPAQAVVETSSNDRIPKPQTAPRLASAFGSLGHSNFGIVSDFAFPASCFAMVMSTGPPDDGLRQW